MRRFEEKDWIFLNMNSPADLHAEYRANGSVLLKEYDRCRDGHFLVSEFYVDGRDFEVELVVESAQDGAVIGCYFGEGGYDRFWQVVLTRQRIVVRRPSGIAMGDTFRYDGAERMEELASTECEVHFPAAVCIKTEGNVCTVSVDGKECFQCELPETENEQGFQVEERRRGEERCWGRLMLGAVNLGSEAETKTVFRKWKLKKECSFLSGKGYLKSETGDVQSGYSIHLCGINNRWTRTNEQGEFVFENLPPGKYHAVAGIAGGDYRKLELEHSGEVLKILKTEKEKNPKKGIFEEVEHAAQKISLNGIWDFEWDKEEHGESEKWFVPGNHRFSKVIRVPFSFHSLEAFGEAFLAGDENLFQANAWYVNPAESGNVVWYQREIEIPESGEWNLVFGAVCGYAKVWLNGAYIGCTVDSYERFRMEMGELEQGQRAVITVRVEYRQNDRESVRGKQDFWFHASPGIWQTVWLEKKQNVRAKDILVEYRFDEAGECADIKGTVIWEVRGKKQKVTEVRRQCGTISCCVDKPLYGVHRVWIEYEAEQTETISLHMGKQVLCSTQLDATGCAGYADRKSVYVSFDGLTQLCISGFQHAFEIKSIQIEKADFPKEIEITLSDGALPDEKDMGVNAVHALVTEAIVLTKDGRMETNFSLLHYPVKRWSPEEPFLYRLYAAAKDADGNRHTFQRRAGFREIQATRYIRINREAVYIRGVLDQGYNPWGLYTYPGDYTEPEDRSGKGYIEYDICKAQEYGYNLIRMHIKDNEPLWYRICDEKGMLVWDEHPVNFYAEWNNPKWRSMYFRRLKDMIRKQNYHPSIILFSTFNESWGIMGGHELSAWEIESAQRWQKKTAQYYKENRGNVLLIDNSGYAKTDETDILDYHMYPDEYEDAASFFERLDKENYAGSCFNCYNQKNKEMMQDAWRRELLQRNCRIDLKTAEHTGDETQHGQPVLLSEFVHTGRLDQLVRNYEGIAGYIRMNLASQENEDTSPLSALRRERDFGYRHFDLTKAGYGYINGENLVLPEMPVLSKKKAGEQVVIPVCTRIWKQYEQLELCVYESRTDLTGTEHEAKKLWESVFQSKARVPQKILEYRYLVPEKVRAVQLFFVVKKGSRVLAENDLRFEVFGKEEIQLLWSLANPVYVRTKESHGALGEFPERDGYYLYGSGEAEWKLPCREYWEKLSEGPFSLRMELSTCECAAGTRITDEQKYPGNVMIELNGKRKINLALEDHPWDEKAVFSNSGCGKEAVVPYKKWGKYGYGFQKEIPLLEEELEEIKRNGYLRIKVISQETGVVIYGRRLGRYGTEPVLVAKHATKTSGGRYSAAGHEIKQFSGLF